MRTPWTSSDHSTGTGPRRGRRRSTVGWRGEEGVSWRVAEGWRGRREVGREVRRAGAESEAGSRGFGGKRSHRGKCRRQSRSARYRVAGVSRRSRREREACAGARLARLRSRAGSRRQGGPLQAAGRGARRTKSMWLERPAVSFLRYDLISWGMSCTPDQEALARSWTIRERAQSMRPPRPPAGPIRLRTFRRG